MPLALLGAILLLLFGYVIGVKEGRRREKNEMDTERTEAYIQKLEDELKEHGIDIESKE